MRLLPLWHVTKQVLSVCALWFHTVHSLNNGENISTGIHAHSINYFPISHQYSGFGRDAHLQIKCIKHCGSPVAMVSAWFSPQRSLVNPGWKKKNKKRKHWLTLVDMQLNVIYCVQQVISKCPIRNDHDSDFKMSFTFVVYVLFGGHFEHISTPVRKSWVIV